MSKPPGIIGSSAKSILDMEASLNRALYGGHSDGGKMRGVCTRVEKGWREVGSRAVAAGEM